MEAIVAARLGIMKAGVWRSISSRVYEGATRLGSIDEITGRIALISSIGSA